MPTTLEPGASAAPARLLRRYGGFSSQLKLLERARQLGLGGVPSIASRQLIFTYHDLTKHPSIDVSSVQTNLVADPSKRHNL